MDFLTKQSLPLATADELIVRNASWGPVIGFSVFAIALLLGGTFFIYSYQLGSVWGMCASAIYVFIVGAICRVMLRVLRALLSTANWLMRISPRGIFIKYRSYLHDDSPQHDPIALQLAWDEIASVHLQQETYITSDLEGRQWLKRQFLVLQLNPRVIETRKIQAALDFEKQRKPEHFKINELQHQLFLARKNKADHSEITRIKLQLDLQRKRNPGPHQKWLFKDTPVTFIEPDQIKLQVTQVTPGMHKLRQLLSQYITIVEDPAEKLDITRPMTDQEFTSKLRLLLDRSDTLEAIKLVRQHLGLTITEAKAYLEKTKQT